MTFCCLIVLWIEDIGKQTDMQTVENGPARMADSRGLGVRHRLLDLGAGGAEMPPAVRLTVLDYYDAPA
jgi:hypothetical protein